VVVEQIRGDARRTGDRQAPEVDPLTVGEGSPVEPDVGSSGLLSGLDGELVTVGWEMADSVQGRR
jgi:hypothetical protein